FRLLPFEIFSNPLFIKRKTPPTWMDVPDERGSLKRPPQGAAQDASSVRLTAQEGRNLQLLFFKRRLNQPAFRRRRQARRVRRWLGRFDMRTRRLARLHRLAARRGRGCQLLFTAAATSRQPF